MKSKDHLFKHICPISARDRKRRLVLNAEVTRLVNGVQYALKSLVHNDTLGKYMCIFSVVLHYGFMTGIYELTDVKVR